MRRDKMALSPARTTRSRRKTNFVSTWSTFRVLAMLLISAVSASAADLSRDHLIRIVTQIQRADYEGDRAALKRLYGELVPPMAENEEMASPVRYWRGFSVWRRAINGFNDKAVEEDLQQAVNEFDEAARKDPGFVDAKVGVLSCLSFLAFGLNLTDSARCRNWLRGAGKF